MPEMAFADTLTVAGPLINWTNPVWSVLCTVTSNAGTVTEESVAPPTRCSGSSV